MGFNHSSGGILKNLPANDQRSFSRHKFSFMSPKALFALAVILFCSTASAFSGEGGVYDANLEVNYAAATAFNVVSSNGVYAGGFTIPGTPSGIWTSSDGAYLFRAGEFFDQNLPVVTITSPTGTIVSSTVSLVYSSTEPGNPINNFFIRLDSGAWINNGLSTTHSFGSVSNGAHTIYVVATDAYDLNSATASTSFSVNTGGGSDSPAISQQQPVTQTSAPRGGSGPAPPTAAPEISVADVENPANIVSKTDYKAVTSANPDGVEVSRKASFQEVKVSGGSTAPIYSFNVGVKNTTNSALKNVKVRETIPKAIASNVSRITFKQAPARIINPDPEVEWLVEELAPGAEAKFFYFVNDLSDKSIKGTFESYVAGLPAAKIASEVKKAEDACMRVSCDDSNICTEDSCSQGACSYNSTPRDGIGCGSKGVCSNGKCVEPVAAAAAVPTQGSGLLEGLLAGGALVVVVVIIVAVLGVLVFFGKKKKY